MPAQALMNWHALTVKSVTGVHDAADQQADQDQTNSRELPSSYRAVTEQLPSSYRAVTEQLSSRELPQQRVTVHCRTDSGKPRVVAVRPFLQTKHNRIEN